MSKMIILYHHPIYRHFENDILVCCSNNGINSLDGQRCIDCEYNKFGSGDNGGKKCSCFRRIWYIDSLNDTEIKYIQLTGKHLGKFSLYIMNLLKQGLKSRYVLTEINYDEEQDEYLWKKVKKIKGSENIIDKLVEDIKINLTHQHEDKGE